MVRALSVTDSVVSGSVQGCRNTWLIDRDAHRYLKPKYTTDLPERGSNTEAVEPQLEIWGNSSITEVLGGSKQQHSCHLILKELTLPKTQSV